MLQTEKTLSSELVGCRVVRLDEGFAGDPIDPSQQLGAPKSKLHVTSLVFGKKQTRRLASDIRNLKSFATRAVEKTIGINVIDKLFGLRVPA